VAYRWAVTTVDTAAPRTTAPDRPAPGAAPLIRRILPAVAGYLAVRAVGLLLLLAYGRSHHHSTLARLAVAWDGGWYVRIAQTGYRVSNGLIGQHGIPYSPRAFFPLYPWLARLLGHQLSVGAGTALVVVSGAAGVVAAAGIYACAAHCCGHRAGVVAAVLWGVLPLAAIENLAYSEALFTAFAAWALYAVLSGRWLWAGTLTVLAGLTRPTAMALTGAVVLAALLELRRWHRSDSLPWRPLAGALLAPLGWVGYMLWTDWVVGSPMGYFHIQDAWGSSFDAGISTVAWYVGLVFVHRSWSGLVTGLTAIAYVWLFRDALRRRQPPALLAFSAGLLVLDLGNSSAHPPLARFLLPAFALLFPLAERIAALPVRRRTALLTCATLLSGGYGVFVVFLGAAPS